MTEDEVVESAAAWLETIHFDGTGCGTTSSNACSICYGGGHMDATEVVKAVFEDALPHLRAMFAEEVAKMLNEEGDSWNDKAAAERHMGIRSSDRANTLWLMAGRVRNYGKGTK